MYGLIVDPVGSTTGSSSDVSTPHAAPSGDARPACTPAPCDSLPRTGRVAGPQRSSNPSPFGMSLGMSLGSAASPASIMAAFTAFVQQMFGQIANWMQRSTQLGTIAPPPMPRYLEGQGGSGGAPPPAP